MNDFEDKCATFSWWFLALRLQRRIKGTEGPLLSFHSFGSTPANNVTDFQTFDYACVSCLFQVCFFCSYVTMFLNLIDNSYTINSLFKLFLKHEVRSVHSLAAYILGVLIGQNKTSVNYNTIIINISEK